MPDYFEIFDLPRKLHLDSDDLQRRFYRLSRELHPDRGGSLEACADLNDAYRTLRDPVKRAEYVLGPGSVSPELLEEVFEAIETGAQLSDADLHDVFARYDAGQATAEEVRAALHRVKFGDRLRNHQLNA